MDSLPFWDNAFESTWMALADEGWSPDENHECPNGEFLEIHRRTVWVKRSSSDDKSELVLTFMPSWAERFILFAAIPFLFGWVRDRSIYVTVTNYGLFTVRLGSQTAAPLRVTRIEQLRSMVRDAVAAM